MTRHGYLDDHRRKAWRRGSVVRPGRVLPDGDRNPQPFTTKSSYTNDDGYDVGSVRCWYSQLG
jgi:hypothetical protein